MFRSPLDALLPFLWVHTGTKPNRSADITARADSSDAAQTRR